MPLQLQKALRLNLRTFRPETNETQKGAMNDLKQAVEMREANERRQSAQTEQVNDHRKLFLAIKSNQSTLNNSKIDEEE